MKIDPYYLRQKMYANDSSFWKHKVHADIRGVPLGGASNESGVVDNGNFCRFQWLLLRKLQR